MMRLPQILPPRSAAAAAAAAAAGGGGARAPLRAAARRRAGPPLGGLPSSIPSSPFPAFSTIAAAAVEERRAKPLVSLPEIPGPRAWPLVGSVPDFVAKVKGFDPPKGPQMTKAYDDYYKEFGPVYRIQMIGGDQHVHVCKPETMLKLYRHEGKYPPGGAENMWMVNRWAGKRGLKRFQAMNSRGEDWKEVRMAVQEDIISPQAARSYLPYINEACRLASPNFGAFSETPDVFSTRLAFDMFTSLLFGLQMKCAAGESTAKDLEYVRNTQRVFHLMGALLFKGHLRWALFKHHPLNREFEDRFERSYKYAAELLQRAVETAKAQPADQKPYIVRLLESGRMPREELEEVTAAFFLAGVDTTQSVLNWNLLHLARSPEKQERLREELCGALGRSGPLTPEAVAQLRARLPYLKAVVRETHRLAPPSAIMTQRKAPCDLELEGCLVPEGTTVAVQIYSVQNDPRYVDRPEAFEPERWLPEAVRARQGTEAEIIDHKLLATPFSFGSRMCLGGRAAELETYAMISQLVRDWRFRTVEESPTWDTIQPLMTKAAPFPSFAVEACQPPS